MQKSYSFNLTPLIGLIFLILFGYFLFSFAKYLYLFLLFSSPVLLIIILLYKKDLLLNFFTRKWNGIKQQPLTGSLNALISLLLLPFTLFGMLFNIIVSKKVEKMQQEYSGTSINTSSTTFTEYEDLSDELNKEKKPETIEDWDLKKWENKF